MNITNTKKELLALFLVLVISLAFVFTFIPKNTVKLGNGEGMFYTYSYGETTTPDSTISEESIKIPMLFGWPQHFEGKNLRSSPNIADLDADGRLELLMGSSKAKFQAIGGPYEPGNAIIHVWNHNGTYVTGWPKVFPDEWEILYPPALGDVDADGEMEIVSVLHHNVVKYAFNWSEMIACECITDELRDHLIEDYGQEWVVNASITIFGESDVLIEDPYSDNSISMLVDYTPKEIYECFMEIRYFDPLPKHISESYVVKKEGGWFYVYNNSRWDYFVNVFNLDGTTLPGWPKQFLGFIWYNPIWNELVPTLADLDGDGTLEVIVFYAQEVFVFDNNGENVTGWPQKVEPSEWIYGLAVGDVDNDTENEIVISYKTDVDRHDAIGIRIFSHDGGIENEWKTDLGGNFLQDSIAHTLQPSLGDLDGDNDLEIFVNLITRDGPGTSAPGQLEFYSWHHNGQEVEGWPRVFTEGDLPPDYPELDSYFKGMSSPSLGDLDGDGKLELSAGVWIGIDWDNMTDLTGLFVLDDDGKDLSGWPKVKLAEEDLSVSDERPPLLADVDGDGDLEIIAVPKYGSRILPYLNAWHHDGSDVDGWPLQLYGGLLSPAIGDVDSDGDIDMLYVESISSIVYGFDLSGGYDFTSLAWPMYRHDPQHTGCYITLSPLPAPILLRPKENASTRRIVTFIWEEVEGASTYELEVSRYEDFHDIYYMNETENRYHRPRKLFYKGKWYWRIRAIAEGNKGEWGTSYFIVDPSLEQ